MLEAQALKVIPLEDVPWPITYRFHVELPWGESVQYLTVDAAALAGDLESSMALGGQLWRRGIAPAMSLQTRLLGWDALMWRFVDAALPVLDGNSRGLLAGPAAPRAHAAVAVLMSDVGGSFAYQRAHLPGSPAAWLDGDKLSLNGRDALEAWGGMMLMGLSGHITGGPLRWLLPYRGVLTPTPGNPGGHAFRRVDYVLGMHHTRAAPVPSLAPWP